MIEEMNELPKRKRGRPAIGRQHVGVAFLYLSAEDDALITALRQRLGLGTTGVLRQAIRLLARREELV